MAYKGPFKLHKNHHHTRKTTLLGGFLSLTKLFSKLISELTGKPYSAGSAWVCPLLTYPDLTTRTRPAFSVEREQRCAGSLFPSPLPAVPV